MKSMAISAAGDTHHVGAERSPFSRLIFGPGKVKETDTAANGGAAIAANTVVQAWGHALVLVIGSASYAVISRHLGPAAFGKYSLVLAYVSLVVGTFANWGFGAIAAREASQCTDQPEAILASAAVLQLAVSSVSYGILMVFSARFLASTDMPPVAIAGVVTLFMPVDVLATILQVRLRLSRAVLVRVIGAVLTFCAAIIAALLGAGIVGVVAATTTAICLRYILLLAVLRGFLTWHRLRLSLSRCCSLISEAWPLALATAFVTLVEQTPVIMLGRLSSADQVGYFSSASRITTQILALPLVLSVSLYPVVARLAKEDRPALSRVASTALRYIIVLAIPLSFMGPGLGKDVVLLLYGPQYLPSAPTLSLLIAQTAVLFPGVIVGEMLIAMGRQRTNLLVIFVEAMVVVAGCYLFLNAAGAVGAAVVALVASVLGTAWVFLVLWRALPDRLQLRGRALALAALAFIVAWFVGRRALPVEGAFIGSTVLYFIVLVALRGVDRQDIRMSALPA